MLTVGSLAHISRIGARWMLNNIPIWITESFDALHVIFSRDGSCRNILVCNSSKKGQHCKLSIELLNKFFLSIH